MNIDCRNPVSLPFWSGSISPLSCYQHPCRRSRNHTAASYGRLANDAVGSGAILRRSVVILLLALWDFRGYIIFPAESQHTWPAQIATIGHATARPAAPMERTTPMDQGQRS